MARNQLDFISKLHTGTRRDYLQRVVEHDKAECAAKAKKWGFDYWDGDRQFGYGGMRYDGRWLPVAEEIAAHYGLKAGDRILDIASEAAIETVVGTKEGKGFSARDDVTAWLTEKHA